MSWRQPNLLRKLPLGMKAGDLFQQIGFTYRLDIHGLRIIANCYMPGQLHIAIRLALC